MNRTAQMLWPLGLSLALGAGPLWAASPGPVGQSSSTATVSTGQRLVLNRHLAPECVTVFVFYRPGDAAEQSFLRDLQQDLQQEAGERVRFRLVTLTSGKEPVAEQYQIAQTPVALVYDRRGRLVTRAEDAAGARAAIGRAKEVMRIDWAEKGDPRLAEAERLLKRPVPGILHTMTLKVEYMDLVNQLSQKAHFADGFINRRTKELIATYVSALNKCKY